MQFCAYLHGTAVSHASQILFTYLLTYLQFPGSPRGHQTCGGSKSTGGMACVRGAIGDVRYDVIQVGMLHIPDIDNEQQYVVNAPQPAAEAAAAPHISWQWRI